MKEIKNFLDWIKEEYRKVEGIVEQREAAYSRIPENLKDPNALEALIAANEAIYTGSLKRQRAKLLEEIKQRAQEIAKKYRARIEIQKVLEYDYFFRRSEGPRITRVSVRVPIVQRPVWNSDERQFKEFVLDLETNDYYEQEFISTSEWNYAKNAWREPFNERHTVIT